MTTFILTVLVMFHQVSARIQSETALITARTFGLLPAAPTPPPIKCDLVNATDTPIEWAVGNILGFAKENAPYLVIGSLALIALGFHRFRTGKGIVGFVLSVLLGLLVLGMVLNNMGLLDFGMGSGKSC